MPQSQANRGTRVSIAQLVCGKAFTHLYNNLSTAQLALGFFVCRSFYVNRSTTLAHRTPCHDDLWPRPPRGVPRQRLPIV